MVATAPQGSILQNLAPESFSGNCCVPKTRLIGPRVHQRCLWLLLGVFFGFIPLALIPRSNGNNSSDQLEPVDPEEDEPRTGMFTIERLVDQGWKRELSCQTEFKAFLNARSRCMASGNTYRVINSDLDVICLITLDGCKRQYGAR